MRAQAIVLAVEFRIGDGTPTYAESISSAKPLANGYRDIAFDFSAIHCLLIAHADAHGIHILEVSMEDFLASLRNSSQAQVTPNQQNILRRNIVQTWIGCWNHTQSRSIVLRRSGRGSASMCNAWSVQMRHLILL